METVELMGTVIVVPLVPVRNVSSHTDHHDSRRAQYTHTQNTSGQTPAGGMANR